MKKERKFVVLGSEGNVVLDAKEVPLDEIPSVEGKEKGESRVERERREAEEVLRKMISEIEVGAVPVDQKEKFEFEKEVLEEFVPLLLKEYQCELEIPGKGKCTFKATPVRKVKRGENYFPALYALGKKPALGIPVVGIMCRFHRERWKRDVKLYPLVNIILRDIKSELEYRVGKVNEAKAQEDFLKRAREARTFKVKCPKCGREFTLNFPPKEGKRYFCPSCFRK